MRLQKKLTITILTIFSLACGGTMRVTKPAVVPPSSISIDVIVQDEQNNPIVGLKEHVNIAKDKFLDGVSNKDGYALYIIPGELNLVDSYVTIEGDGTFEGGDFHLKPTACHDGCHNVFTLKRKHITPDAYTFQQLANIRGAMWPHAGFPGLPFGPRPGDETNIIATGSWNCYTTEQRDSITAMLKANNYTHVVYGPFAPTASYHGQYCDPTTDFHKWLDDLEDLWDRGFIPIVFLHPDNYSFQQTVDYYTPLFASDSRVTKLIKVVVPSGWEPTKYGWSSQTWSKYIVWARTVFGPSALVLIHTVADVDAPVGTDDAGDDNGKGNGLGWQHVFDAGLDGWLIQNGAYTTDPDVDTELAKNFCSQFDKGDLGAQLHGVRWHFMNAIAGWPAKTWRGLDFLLYNGEVTAYSGYWNNLPENVRIKWGSLAMKCGADGALDGVGK